VALSGRRGGVPVDGDFGGVAASWGGVLWLESEVGTWWRGPRESTDVWGAAGERLGAWAWRKMSRVGGIGPRAVALARYSAGGGESMTRRSADTWAR
jgi:hypothetical protein